MFIFVLVVLILCCLINDRKKNADDKEKNVNKIYKNVIIKKVTDDSMVFLSENKEIEYRVNGISEKIENVLADIEIVNGNIKLITIKRESISGKVQAIWEDGIEIEGFGKLLFSKECKCYLKNKGYILGNMKDIKVGAENITFIVEDKYICGLMIEEEAKTKKIRVLLKNTGFKEDFHDKVILACQGDYKVSYNEIDSSGNLKNVTDIYSKDSILEFVPDDKKFDCGRITIEPVNEGQKIEFQSFTRNGRNPSYRGMIEIARYEGKIVIINEVLLEEYLYSVVPSEMPSSYGVEALKVQAVCARSYAMSHLGGGELNKYGAQIDDSTNYQVYNNTQETQNSIEAVDATRGEILKYEDEVINAYFFATSCGNTTDSDIWGGEKLPYIKGKWLSDSQDIKDLTNNDVFTEFIKSSPESFDNESGWYRWNISFSNSEITEIINNNIKYIANKFPKYVLVKQEDGTFISKDIDNIGNVLNVCVELRGTGGVIEELLIVGDKNTVKILKQSAIRNLINPKGIEINKSDGTKINTLSSLPSAYFSIERCDNGYVLYGGGFGHGVGMSQTAVKQMIAKGMDYKEILTYFYTGVRIEKSIA